MKTLQITIIVIFLILALAIIHNPSYAQTPQNPCYPLYQDPYFGNCERLSGIYPQPIVNGTLDVLVKTEPKVFTVNTTEDRILHIKFFDKGTGRPISYLSFILNVTKGNQRLMSDRFFNINGTSTINFQEGNTAGKWEVFADQYFTQGWYNFGRSVTVKAPIFHEPGLYHISLTIDNPDDRASTSDKITYNSYVKVDKNNFEVIPSSPLQQIKSGIPAQDVQCTANWILIIKSSDNSPVCVRPYTSHVLIQRGWAKESVQTKENELVEMTVTRITNNTWVQGANYSMVKTISYETLAKHPQLQYALHEADKQLEKFTKFCENSRCITSLPLPFTATYSTKIPTSVAKSIADDPYLYFSAYPSPPSSLKISYVNVDGIVYIVYLFFPQ